VHVGAAHAAGVDGDVDVALAEGLERELPWFLGPAGSIHG
jgi:hypothetical protein